MPATLYDDRELSRFEMDDDGILAVANYRLAGNLITFTHTEVPPQARGHGLASRLIAGALETARARAGLRLRRTARSCAISSPSIPSITI